MVNFNTCFLCHFVFGQISVVPGMPLQSSRMSASKASTYSSRITSILVYLSEPLSVNSGLTRKYAQADETDSKDAPPTPG